jgi:hypothetical protein
MDQINNEVKIGGKPYFRGGFLPALTLALLAPVVAEVLFGSTRLSFIFVLIPEIMVWVSVR